MRIPVATNHFTAMYDPLVRTGLTPGASITAATTLTSEDSGRLYELNKADGNTVTLPALVANGPIMRFEFILGTLQSSGSGTVITGAANSMWGQVYSSTGGDADSQVTAGTAVTFTQATSVVSDRCIVVSNPAGTRWYAYCWCNADAGITIA